MMQNAVAGVLVVLTVQSLWFRWLLRGSHVVISTVNNIIIIVVYYLCECRLVASVCT
jgi:hypothetical protein